MDFTLPRGRYLKFFRMFEDDIKIPGHLAIQQQKFSTDDFGKYINQMMDAKEAKKAKEGYQEKLDLINDAVTNAILRDPNSECQIRSIYEPRLKHHQDKLNE